MSVEDVALAIEGFAEDKGVAWSNFLDELLSNEVVRTALGWASFKDRQNTEPNSYGYYDSDEEIWFVFKLGERYYRKSGYQDSYDDFEYDGALVEVEPAEVQKITWKVK